MTQFQYFNANINLICAILHPKFQRRPGLHVDSPGKVRIKDDTGVTEEILDNGESCARRKGNGKSQRYLGHGWGSGCAHYVRRKPDPEDDDANRKYMIQPYYIMKVTQCLISNLTNDVMLT